MWQPPGNRRLPPSHDQQAYESRESHDVLQPVAQLQYLSLAESPAGQYAWAPHPNVPIMYSAPVSSPQAAYPTYFRPRNEQRPVLSANQYYAQAGGRARGRVQTTVGRGHPIRSQQQNPSHSSQLQHLQPSTSGLEHGNPNISTLPTINIDQILGRLHRLPPGASVGPILGPYIQVIESRSIGVIIKQLANSSQPQRAWDVFEWLRSQQNRPEHPRLLDVYVYTTMISLCTRLRDLERAINLFDEMRESGVVPNVHTFSTIMNVAIKCGQLQRALDVYHQMREEGCTPNIVTYNTLIDVYGKTGQWNEAIQVFNQMIEEGISPVTRTFNTLMIALNSSGQWHEALAFHQRMVAAGVAPNTTTFNALISAYTKAGRLDKVMEVFSEMVALGCERSVITYTSLINACERAGDWVLALEVYQKMRDDGVAPNVVTFNSLITACAQGGQWRHAEEVFAAMPAAGVVPDVVTYTALISAYERGGQWQLALKAFNEMQSQVCEADSILYTAIIDVLWDAGTVSSQAAAIDLYRCGVAAGMMKSSGFTQSQLPPQPPASSQQQQRSMQALERHQPQATTSSLHSSVSAQQQQQQLGAIKSELALMSLSSGVAMATFKCWLADMMELCMLKGVKALPSKIEIVVGKSRQREASSSSDMQDAILAWLGNLGAPLTEVRKEVGPPGAPPHAIPSLYLEAAGVELGRWLCERRVQVALARFRRPSGPPSSPHHSVLDTDVALSLSCSTAFSGVLAYEATHDVGTSSLNPVFLQQRSSVVDTIVQVTLSLNRQLEVAHDSVVLMDWWASKMALTPAGPSLLTVGVACMMLRMTQEEPNAQDLIPAQLSSITGIPANAITSSAVYVAAAVCYDIAAISPIRVVNIYIARLGADQYAPGDDQTLASVTPSVLLGAALRSLPFLSYRPSVTAAAALHVSRAAAGALPLWPAALAHMTGMRPSTHQALAAAISDMNRLCQQVSRQGAK